MKIYKKYELKSTFGLVTSGSVSVSKNSCLCFSNEFVLNWDLKTGELLTSNKMDSLVTFVKNKKRLAIGMVDGCVVVLNHLDSNINHAIESSIDNEIKLNGHSKFITWLEFDIEGNRLLSCSGDTDLVLWDLVLEQGLKRFQGHKDAVTCAKFVRDYILSTSKDGTLKIWDQLGICLETCLEHRGEIWSFDVLELDDKVLLVTGCADGACRVFELDLQVLSEKFKQGEIKRGLKFLGFLSRTNNEKITSIKIHEDYCGVQGGDRIVEIFKIKTLAELKRLESKKIKKMEKKGLEPIELGISDRISSHCIVNCSSHVKSFDIANEKHGLKVTCGLSNNSIESYIVDYIASPSRLQTQIQLPGHRNDIRTLCLSSDDQLLASGSHNQLKLWNVNTANCIVTFESGYCTASIFLPGNKHVLVGTKQGRLELYEVASGNLLEAQEAHQGSIWSIAMLPDKSGIASGGQDKTVKIWDFVLLEDIEYSKINKRPSVKHTKSLKLQDDILALKVSPCGKFLAVSLLDMTVKIFYLDSFKFFLNLYGHKLPVVTMDISFDSRLIITGSSDKTVKIWGLDFGDCHKSLLKHTDSVMQVGFVWGTYYFFTASKDATIRYWDAEKFELLSTLKAHHAEVWAMVIGKYGNFVATAGHDRSIRIWERTEEQFVAQEEREAELEELYEKMELQASQVEQGLDANGVPIDTTKSVTKTTTESLKSGEIIYEAIMVWNQETLDLEKYADNLVNNPEFPRPIRNSFWAGQGCSSDLDVDDSLLFVINKIRTSHLHDALLTLNFSTVLRLFRAIDKWTAKNINPILVNRILSFLLKDHHDEISTTRSLKPFLENIRVNVAANIKRERNIVGYNISALKFLKQDRIDAGTVVFGEQKPVEEAQGVKRKRVAVVS